MNVPLQLWAISIMIKASQVDQFNWRVSEKNSNKDSGYFRLAKAVTELAKHSIRADKAIKERQKLENLNSANEEQGGSHEIF